MKIMRLSKLLSLLVLFMLAAVPESHAAWNAADGVYYLKTADGLEETYKVSGQILFKSQSGTTIPSYRDCGVVFAPANPGEVIQITVKSIDLDGGNYLLAYDGAIENIKSGMSDGIGQSAYLPAGWKKKFIKGMEEETYLSEAPDGMMSFGFHSGSPNNQSGFTILVESISLKDMEFVDSKAFSPSVPPRRGEKDAYIMGICVEMDGSFNPMSLDKLVVDCSTMTSVSSLSGIRLVKDGLTVATLASGQTKLNLEDFGLRSGRNNFYVVADVAPDAFGDVPIPSVESMTVGGQPRTVYPVSVPADRFAGIVWMSPEHQVFTIDAPVDFYDDGGPEGKISSKFEGMVTFVPSAEGSAVKIDFTEMAIFNTSSTGMNDVLTVYNGREADDANIIATLLKEPEMVKSTATDGSLTVKLVSKTGVPAEGWTARVSQYLPGDMTLSSIETSLPSDAQSAVRAGQSDVAMIIFDVVTDNVASPLTVDAVNLSSETPSLLGNLKIWYLGRKVDMDAKTLCGSSESAATIRIAAPRELTEGHNWFAVTSDIAPEAGNDAAVSVALSSVEVGGESHALEAINATRTVRNVLHLDEGTELITLYGPWEFRPMYNTATGYTDRYKPGQTDQIVTFVPAEAGCKTQIDFSEFVLTYTGSQNAKFEIYSGHECDESQLLWKLSSAADRNHGPGQTLRSLAADGSMTIRFNPNTTSNYYCATGWVASVKPFRDHDMSIIASSASRPDLRETGVGSLNQDMLDFSLKAEGTLSVKTLKSMRFDIDGAEALSAVRVYASFNEDMSDAVLFGETTDVKAQTSVEGNLSLAEGTRYFRLRADISPDAEPETVVCVGIASVTDTQGVTDDIPDGNPEGGRTVKSILLTESGNHVITVARPLMWYDDGGADGKMTSGMTATYTFVPKEDGYAVRINSELFKMGNGRMYVYSGREAVADRLLGTVTGYSATTGPSDLISKAEDGSLTVTVKAPTSSLDGFAISVDLHEKMNYTLGSAVSAAATDFSTCVRGSRDLPLVKIAASVAGDMGESRLSDFCFSLTGTDDMSDITALRLYATGDADGFSPAMATMLGEVVPEGQAVWFDAENETGDNGTFYYWLTADIADNAVPGDKITVVLTSVDFNGETVAAEGSVSGLTVKAGLKGTFTIGKAGADYSDFKSAATALEEGVEGPVTFEIMDGTYAENLKVISVRGTSAAHPVEFRSQSGKRDAVVITGNYTATEKAGAVQIVETPYVTIRDVTVDVTASSSFENAVYIANGSRSCSLLDCEVSAAAVTSGYSGTYPVRSFVSTALGAGCNNDSLRVENCHIQGGYAGMNIGGTGVVALPKQQGVIIRGNTVDGAYSNGIYITDQKDAIVEGNTVSWNGSKKGYVAIRPYRMLGRSSISTNRVLNTGAVYSTGIEVYDACKGEAEAPIRIWNNEIILTRSDAYTGRAIQLANAASNIDIAYNTFRVAGTNAYVMATSGTGTPTGMQVRGNIFQNGCSAGSIPVYFWNNTDVTGYRFSGNSYYSTDGNVCKNDSKILDFDGFTALTSDDASIFEEAIFLSDTDSHLAEAGNLRCGLPVDGLLTDIEGKVRPASGLTLGAYEYYAPSTEAPAIEAGYPAVASVTESSAVVRTRWNAGGRLFSIVREWTEGDNLPEAEDVTTGEGSVITSGVEISTKFESLSPSTVYKAFFVAESASGVRSSVVASEAFTTLRHIGPLTLKFDDEKIPVVEAGANFAIVPYVAGGDEPYVYEWTDQMKRSLGNDAILSLTPEVSAAYTLKVTSADGQTVEATTAVEVLGELKTATFDDNWLEEESHVTPEGDTRFYSGSFAFNAGGMPEYSFWYGYTISSETSSDFTGLSDQFRSAPGGAFEGMNYGVGYPQGLTVDVTNNPEGDIIPGFYVANGAYTLSSMLNGDGFARKFTKGDWLKLTATGIVSSGESISKDFYLADLRDSREAEHYILDTWEWFDLRSLGKVKSVRFTFDGSDRGSFGLNTPEYFCMDLFGAMPVADIRSIAIPEGQSVDLAEFFNEDTVSGAEAIYSIEVPEDAPFALALDGSRLTLNKAATRTETENEAECLASLRQKGKSQYLRLLVSEDTTTTGVAGVEADDIRLYPVPVTDRLNVSTRLENYSVEVISSTGAIVHHEDGLCGPAVIAREGWSAGVYVVRVVSADGVKVKNIIVK